MFCPHCAKANKEQAKFCEACGKVLPMISAAAASMPPPVPGAPPAYVAAAQPVVTPRKKGLPWWIKLILFLIISSFVLRVIGAIISAIQFNSMRL